MWFEPLVKYPPQAFENGEVVFTNVVQPVWWLVAALVVALLVAASALLGLNMRTLSPGRRGTVALLQIAFVVGIGVLLAGPALEIAMIRPGANVVAVMVDTSLSMGFPAGTRESRQSRLDVARVVIADRLGPTLGEVADVVLFGFDESVSRRDTFDDMQATGEQTRLVEATANVLSGFQREPLAAVIVLSDGADNVTLAQEFAELATGVPVHTIGIGPLEVPGEVRLAKVTMPADTTAGSQVTAQVQIEHSSVADGRAMLRVRDGERLLAALPVELPKDASTVRAEISFDSGAGGIRELSFDIEPSADDQLEPNNHIQRLLTVSERRRRVLYLEGEPRWEYKYLRRALARDDVLKLVSWLRTTERKTYRQGVADADDLVDGLPADRETLYGFDVIVLGSLAATELTEQQHAWLESFVAQRGGSVLVLAGRDALADGGWDVQPLADALPVVISRESGPTYEAVTDPRALVQPTAAGLVSALTQFPHGDDPDVWGSLPPLGDLQRLGEAKPAATTLLELLTGDNERIPLLVTQPYGLGTTAVLATATTWRWQMRTPPDDPRHRMFWRHLLRQLAETAQRPRDFQVGTSTAGELMVHVSTNDATFEPTDLLQVNARITAPDNSETTVAFAGGDGPGRLVGKHAATVPGVYRVDVELTDEGGVETMTRFVRVGSTDVEYQNPEQNVALLERVADATGGRYWTPGQASDIAEHLRFSSSGIRTIRLLSLWDMPIVFIGLLALKFCEWLLRRRWGRI